MPSAAATKSRPKAPKQKVAHARAAEPVLVKGRRDFFKYRDLGVADASAGTLRAQVMSSSQGMSRPTGWHYHECDGQFIYMLDGWVDLEFEDDEIRTSDKMEILEVSSPGHMGTTPCDLPKGFKG